jgi:hypothetical protein
MPRRREPTYRGGVITRYACPLCDWVLEVPAVAIASGEIVDALSPDDIALELRGHGLSHTAATLLAGDAE